MVYAKLNWNGCSSTNPTSVCQDLSMLLSFRLTGKPSLLRAYIYGAPYIIKALNDAHNSFIDAELFLRFPPSTPHQQIDYMCIFKIRWNLLISWANGV